MRLYEKYRPQSLADCIGQFPVRELQAFAYQPYAKCWLFEGPGGVGKTSAALALAADLGCHDDLSGLTLENATDFGIDKAKELLQRTAWTRPLEGNGWRVLVIDELEMLSPQCGRFLKTALEPREMHKRLVVIATSNGAGKLERPLLQRFDLRHFTGGPTFAAVAADRLRDVWAQETDGAIPPADIDTWGWDEDNGQRCFSLRLAYNRMEAALVQRFLDSRMGAMA